MPSSVVRYITVIVPVHPNDLVYSVKQWYTRVLYNAYLPFYYSYILDTHVFPCYNNSYSEIFRLFKESNVDISVSNRMNTKSSISGGAVLSKWGPRSGYFWLSCAKYMKGTHNYDDQKAISVILSRSRKRVTFKKLSSNYFYASNGITSYGAFKGASKCYRSSVVLTGPIHWVHGSPSECPLMNGQNNELAYTNRVYFRCGRCKCAKKGPLVATSANQLKSFAYPNIPPRLMWEKNPSHDSTSLFWSYYVCLIYVI